MVARCHMMRQIFEAYHLFPFLYNVKDMSVYKRCFLRASSSPFSRHTNDRRPKTRYVVIRMNFGGKSCLVTYASHSHARVTVSRGECKKWPDTENEGTEEQERKEQNVRSIGILASDGNASPDTRLEPLKKRASFSKSSVHNL